MIFNEDRGPSDSAVAAACSPEDADASSNTTARATDLTAIGASGASTDTTRFPEGPDEILGGRL